MATAKSNKWWRNAIIYQIYPRSFYDGNGDGIGDIQGIISKLQYLKDLGIDAIWLGAIFPTSNYDLGYDIIDFKSINPDYGTIEDMEKLISKAKRLGIKIILEFPIIHTSDEHPWFKKALAGDEKYRNFYYIKEGNGNKPPNNWQSIFGGRAWQKTEQGDYYLHLFSKHQPDLNWSNPDVYDEIADVMRFWLDKGIAGFKYNAVNLMYKISLADGERGKRITGIEHYINADGCHEILKRFNQEVWSKYKCFNVGETFFISEEDARLLCDEDRLELDSVFYNEHYVVAKGLIKAIKKNTRLKPNKFAHILDKWQEAIKYPSNALENRDTSRSISRYGNTLKYWNLSAKMLCGMDLSMKGIPYIYQGQEIGMTNADYVNVEEQKSKEPMQWDDTVYAGFTTGTPWFNVNSNNNVINVKTELEDENSILNFYKSMIDFRKNSNAMLEGDYRRVASSKDIFIFTRESYEERLYVYCNLTSFNRAVEFYGDRIVFDNYKDGEIEDFYLKPYEFRIIKSNI